MSCKKLTLLSACALSILSLTACGEGWEMVRVENGADYSNDRTAGSTIMWVQKSMMPTKELKIDDPVAEVVEDETDLEEEVEENLEETTAEIIEAPPAVEVPQEEPAAPVDLTASEMDKLFRDVQAK